MCIADDMRRHGDEEAAEMLELAMDSYLRTQDLGLLRVEDVSSPPARPGEPLLVSLQLGVVERGETTKTGVRQGVIIDFPRVARATLRRAAGRSPKEKLFKTSTRQYTNAWRKAVRRLGLTFVGPPHSVRHTGPSRDHFLGYRTLTEIQKRGRWMSKDSVFRYSKDHVLVQMMARQPAAIRARGEELFLEWGERAPHAR